jgi:superfamily II DNA or RNA helicase
MSDLKLHGDREFIFKLRTYQNQVLELFEDKIARGEKQIHVVAPPGSGKTIMGLAMLMKTQMKGVVFSPNAAIQMQWAQRFSDSTDIFSQSALHRLTFGTRPDDIDPYLSLTYQSVTTKDKETGELHSNAKETLKRLTEEGYRVFIFDECHHLTGFWGETLGSFMASMDDAIIIGLTATPPAEATGSKLRTYLDIVGNIDITIPLPSIVKEGNLSPYQDLVYFTRPEESEVVLLLEGQTEYRKLIADLEKMELPRIALSMWVQKMLEDCRLKGKIVPFDEWLRNFPDQAIAYVRYLKFSRITIPLTVIWVDEMDGDFETEDLALILNDYIRFHLKVLDKEKLSAKSDKEEGIVSGKEWIERISDTLSKIGYQRQGNSFQAVNTGSARNMTLSKTKLSGMRKILIKESERDLDGLRALILVDYEFGQNGTDGINAIEVMKAMTSDDGTDILDPIMLTGRSVLVDDDLLPKFLEKAEVFKRENNLSFELTTVRENEYERVSGSGPDWNTRNYVQFITKLLEEGVTKTIIGTRSLLGEGWDAIKLNTLVDLTVVASFVSVNQIRGRTIRKDSENPFKCANNWDLVTIYPGLEYGLYDYKRLEKKHNHFYGVSDDGVIEKGLGHVHPFLSKGKAGLLSSNIDVINEDMLNRCLNRDSARDRWKVGEAYDNSDVDCVELYYPSEKPYIKRQMQTIEKIEYMKVIINESKILVSRLMDYWWLIAPLIIAAGQSIYTRFQTRQLKSIPMMDEPFSKTLSSFSEVVLESAKETKLLPPSYSIENISVHKRDHDCYRVMLEGASESDSLQFSEAIWEVLGPVQNHKYIIERRQFTLEMADLTYEDILNFETVPTELIACHPVPSIFGQKREFADIFRKWWNQIIGPGEIFYTRRGEGKELVKKWFRKRTIEVSREQKKVWV